MITRIRSAFRWILGRHLIAFLPEEERRSFRLTANNLVCLAAQIFLCFSLWVQLVAIAFIFPGQQANLYLPVAMLLPLLIVVRKRKVTRMVLAFAPFFLFIAHETYFKVLGGNRSRVEGQGSFEPRLHNNATVCFTDFQGFTQIAETLSPTELVGELDRCFSYFGLLADLRRAGEERIPNEEFRKRYKQL